MAVAIDGTSPTHLTSTGTGAGTATLTTASFTPPAGAMLVAACMSNAAAGVTQTFTSTASVGGALTTRIFQHDNSSTPNGQPGGIAILTLENVTNVARTVAATRVNTAESGWMLKVWVITGCETSFSGATNRAGSGSGAPTVSLTALGTGSLVLWCSTDWSQLGLGTGATGNTILHEQNVSGQITNHTGQRTALTSAPGAVSCGMSLPATQDYNIAAIEIRDSGVAPTQLQHRSTYPPLLVH